jgi:prevent-host-death family protein
MKIESLREVKNNFSEVIEALAETGPVVVTRNGKSAALLIPIDENTDLETLILSNSPRFWELFDRAASGERAPLESLPDPNDDAAWGRLRKDSMDRPSYQGEKGGPCPKCEWPETVSRKSRTTGELYFGCARPKRGRTGGCNFKGCRSH